MEKPISPDHFKIPLTRLHLHSKEILLLGTAHISQESVAHVREAILREKPDCVCVELDAGRLKALTDPERWKSLDLKTVIRQGQLPTLIANLALSAYQKRMGLFTGTQPGAELLHAVRTAEEAQIPVELIDREVKITLQRAWRKTPWYRKVFLLSALVESLFDRSRIDEEQLRNLREQDTINTMMDDLGKQFPEIRSVVIAERDLFMARRILQVPGRKILAVVGAGHLSGIEKILRDSTDLDFADIDQTPPPNPLWRWFLYSIPIAFLGVMIFLAYSKGLSALGENIALWILITGCAGALGTALALPHPLVILVAFVMTPLKPFRPIVGTGVFTALTQAWLLPPRVEELQSAAEDLQRPLSWWKNRLLRIALCGLLPAPFTLLGYAIAGKKLLQNLLS